MNNSVCQFIPVKSYTGSLKIIHFVYETELPKLHQPFLHATFYLHLVAGGSAVLKMAGKSYPLHRGDLFFTFPGCPFELTEDTGLVYIYISFTGSCASEIMTELEINLDHPVYHGYENLLEFWKSSIIRINQLNANILAESVLLYTLSFINNKTESMELKSSSENLFDIIVDYVDTHYRDADLSLKKLSGIFPYTEKYLSSLFHRKMNVRFSSYLNSLRLQYAHQLMDEGNTSVSSIAQQCGYSDSLYFSKVFKKRTGESPRAYLAKLRTAHRPDARDRDPHTKEK